MMPFLSQIDTEKGIDGTEKTAGLGLAAELGVVVTLPLLLLGCGGRGSSSSPPPGMMTGQFWTDLTGAGLREFWPGSLATASVWRRVLIPLHDCIVTVII